MRTYFIVAVTLSLLHCNGNGEPLEPDALSASCIEAKEQSDLVWIQENILQKSCVFSSCHKGLANQAGGLSLEAGMVEEQTVNKSSTAFPDWLLVKPGSPSESYLMALMDHITLGGRYDAPLSMAGAMPWNSPLLCIEKREAVERWILSLQPDGGS